MNPKQFYNYKKYEQINYINYQLKKIIFILKLK